MSTQEDTKFIPLAFAHEHSPVRLLELPPSLLSLVENATATGTPSVVKIKSLPAITSSSSSEAPGNSNGPQPFAVLTTPTETFTIRNVHSSNSIFILKPAIVPPLLDHTAKSGGDEDIDMLSESLETASKPGVVVSSICSSHLELLPQKPNAELLLKSLLVEYASPKNPPTRPSDAASKSQIILDTPVSDAEFAIGWTGIDAFEIDGWALRLSPTSALEIFRNLNTIMIANAGVVDLDWRTTGLSMDKIIDIVNEDGELEDWPTDAIRAIVRSSWIPRDLSGNKVWLFDHSSLTKWAGKHILTSNPAKSFSEKEFLEIWKKTVPEDSIDLTNMSLLEGLCSQSVLGVIQYSYGDSRPVAEGANTGSLNSKKKKWHEKFAATKKR